MRWVQGLAPAFTLPLVGDKRKMRRFAPVRNMLGSQCVLAATLESRNPAVGAGTGLRLRHPERKLLESKDLREAMLFPFVILSEAKNPGFRYRVRRKDRLARKLRVGT